MDDYVDPKLLKMWAQGEITDTDTARVQDLAEKQAALDSSSPVRVAEPILSPQEISDCIGQLTMTCESLRRDIVALEKRIEQKQRRKSTWRRFRAWLVSRWIAQELEEMKQ